MSLFSIQINKESLPIPLYNNARLYSFYDPIKEATRYADQKYSGGKNIIIIGDVGFYLAKVLSCHQARPKLFVIAPRLKCDQATLLQHNLPPQAIFFDTDNLTTLLAKLDKALTDKMLFETQILVWQTALNLVPNLKELASTIYCYFSQRVATLKTANHFGFNWIKNGINHSLSSCQYHTIPKSNKPVVIVASGASLNGLTNFLKKIRERVTLICVSSAYLTLLHYKIDPDYLVATDGGYYAKRLLAPLHYSSKNLPIFITTLHGACTNYPKVALIDQGSIVDKALSGFHKYAFSLEETPSVSCTALLLARKIWEQEIFVVGLDLGSNNEKLHCVPHISINRLHTNSSRLNQVQCSCYNFFVGGSLVSLQRYKEWFLEYTKRDTNWYRVEATMATELKNTITASDAYNLICSHKKNEHHSSTPTSYEKKITPTKNEIAAALTKHKKAILEDFYPNFEDEQKAEIWKRIMAFTK